MITAWLILIFVPAMPVTWQWIIDLAGPVLVAQAIGGLIGLGTLVIVTRRFLSTDFPAAMLSVNKRLDEHASAVNKRLDDHTRLFERLDLDIRKLVLDLAQLNERHISLRGRVDRIEQREERLDLDDTRTSRRKRRETDGE